MLDHILLALAVASLITLLQSGLILFAGEKAVSPGSGILLFVKILQGVIIMPVVEEVIFRGIIIDSLHQYKTSTMITISTIVFSLGHLNLINSLIALPMGILLAYIIVKTRNIWITILLHITVNFYGSILIPLLLVNGATILAFLISLILIVIGILIVMRNRVR